MAVLSAEDIREKKISACKIFIFAVFAVMYRGLEYQYPFSEIVCCILPGGILLLVSLLTKESIGYGDGVAVMVLGLWTGAWFTAGVLCVAVILAGLFGIGYLVMGKRDAIPFIPFLLVGLEVMLFYA